MSIIARQNNLSPDRLLSRTIRPGRPAAPAALAPRHALAFHRPRRSAARNSSSRASSWSFSREVANLSMPNEDSRAIDLEDLNLFAINRFPGYDRIEDSEPDHLRLRLSAGPARFRASMPTIGQSYRLEQRAPASCQTAPGLSDRLSDIVGRTQLRYKDFLADHAPLPAWIRTISPSAATRSTPRSGRSAPMSRSAICASTAM